jgi:hypothetical protein
MRARVRRLLVLLLFSASCLLIPSGLYADDYTTVCSLLSKAEARASSLTDYTLTLMKQERLGDKLLPQETVFIKFKKPMSVYIKNLTGKHVNREVIYVKGENNDKMIVSPAGIFGGLSVRISPDSILAKRESRHTITEAGLPHIIARMIQVMEEDTKKPACLLNTTYLGEGYCSPEKVIRVRIEGSSYAPKTEIALDASTLLPAEIASYDAEGRLLEYYRYLDVKTNVGLTAADFDPKNPDYHF